MSNEITQSIGMWIGNKQITNYYLGSKPAVYTANLSKGPLPIQFIAVGGGDGGRYQSNTLDGSAGGNGGNWITSSLLIAPTDYITIQTGSGGVGGSYSGGTGTSGGPTLIKNSSNTTIITTATNASAGGSGGAGGINGSTNCGQSAPAGGIVWFDGVGYAGGGGGGACGTDAFCSQGGNGTNGGGNGANTATTGVRGGGGGGGRGGNKEAASDGGPGIVTIRYFSGTQLATGGTVTFSNGYWYHTFSTSGTFTYS